MDTVSVTSSIATIKQTATTSGPLAPAAFALREAVEEMNRFVAVMKMISHDVHGEQKRDISLERIVDVVPGINEEKNRREVVSVFAIKSKQLTGTVNILKNGATKMRANTEMQAKYFKDLTYIAQSWKVEAPLHSPTILDDHSLASQLLSARGDRKTDRRILRSNEPLTIDCSFATGN